MIKKIKFIAGTIRYVPLAIWYLIKKKQRINQAVDHVKKIGFQQIEKEFKEKFEAGA